MTRWIYLHYKVLVLLAMVGMGRFDSWHFTGENVARGKPTEQRPGTWSGTLSGTFYGFTSNLAVDGNTANTLTGGSCSHTDGPFNTRSYWSVDLRDLYFVKGIRIYNREIYRYHLDNFKVLGNPDETTLHDDATTEAKMSWKDIIDIPVPATQFSNITITIPAVPNTSPTLILCEVEIYGELKLNNCTTANTDDQLVWNVKYGYMDKVRNLVVADSVIEFSCPPYYNFTGAISATCLSTGSFNVSLPRCLETPCQAPPIISNGAYTNVLKTEYSYHETVTWDCSDGYKSDQNRTRQCLPTSKWSGTGPLCTLIMCPYPSGFSKGELVHENNDIYSHGNVKSGTIVTVNCDRCFESNIEAIHCTQDEIWSTAPQCSQVECDSLGSFIGGHYTYSMTAMLGNYVCDTIAEVYCYDNFKKAVDTRTCGQHGNWSGSDTLPCDRICHTPPEIENGSYTEVLVTGYLVGKILTWDCSEGYKSSQNRIRQCLDTSEWSGSNPVCTLIACPFPNIASEVSLTLGDGSAYTSGPLRSGMTVKLHCGECFEFSVASITCGLDEEWDNAPICSRIECDGLGLLPGGLYNYKDKDGNDINNTVEKYACGTVADVHCGVNYNQTSDTRICGEDSRWTGNDVPCIRLLTEPDTERASGQTVVYIVGIVAALVVVGVVTAVLVFILVRKRHCKLADTAHRQPAVEGPLKAPDFKDRQPEFDCDENTDVEVLPEDLALKDRQPYFDRDEEQMKIFLKLLLFKTDNLILIVTKKQMLKVLLKILILKTDNDNSIATKKLMLKVLLKILIIRTDNQILIATKKQMLKIILKLLLLKTDNQILIATKKQILKIFLKLLLLKTDHQILIATKKQMLQFLLKILFLKIDNQILIATKKQMLKVLLKILILKTDNQIFLKLLLLKTDNQILIATKILMLNILLKILLLKTDNQILIATKVQMLKILILKTDTHILIATKIQMLNILIKMLVEDPRAVSDLKGRRPDSGRDENKDVEYPPKDTDLKDRKADPSECSDKTDLKDTRAITDLSDR